MGAYSVTDNVISLGDYNLNYLNKTEKSKQDIFASNLGLEIVNLRDATRCTDETFTLIDHRFVSKDQIIANNVTTNPFNSGHFLVIFESNLSLKSETDNILTMRNFRIFSGSKFNRDLALAEWRRRYQCENGNDMFDSFIGILRKLLKNTKNSEKLLVNDPLTENLLVNVSYAQTNVLVSIFMIS